MTVSVVPTLDLERELASQNYDIIVGFDEVGRGSLAGPAMVGAAAIFSRDIAQGLAVPTHVADSKMLTAHRREQMFDDLCAWCASYAVGSVSNHEIDEWGIGYALGIAALRALDQVEQALLQQWQEPRTPRVAAILDGPYDYITKIEGTFDAPLVPIPAHVVTKVKGDQHCATVATAAVIAKVTRDRLMVDLAHSNPQYEPYQWASNKGYGSKAHREAIAQYGPSDLHRISWHLT